MSADLLYASNVDWFRRQADDVINTIYRLTRPANPPDGTAIDMFRPGQVPNVTDREAQRTIPTGGERLIRWDTLHPGDRNGCLNMRYLPMVVST